jgi:hypothetical protein
MYLRITAPTGEILGDTPINAAISPCDGSYGLIEFLDGDTDRVDAIEQALIDGIRDQCEPISFEDFDPKVGMTCEFEGFKGELIDE